MAGLGERRINLAHQDLHQMRPVIFKPRHSISRQPYDRVRCLSQVSPRASVLPRTEDQGSPPLKSSPLYRCFPILPPPTTRPSFAEPSLSPSERAGTRRSFCGLLLTWCASKEPDQWSSLPLLAAIHSEPLPILPVAPEPSCAVKPAILFGLVGLPAELLLNRLTTQLLRLLDPTSPPATTPACAQHVTAEAHYLGFPWFPLGFNSGNIVEGCLDYA
jgi:hypothetical protein